MRQAAATKATDQATDGLVQSGVAPTLADEIRQAGRLLPRIEFEDALRTAGFERYHIHHPFHKRMNAGELTKAQMQAWALNRYCYQAAIPKKDAIILSRSEEPAFRREWRKRIVDHDGDNGGETDGGIKRWLKLAEGLDLDVDMVKTRRYALPATRYAVAAYIDLVSSSSLLVAVASSLTELFSPVAHWRTCTGHAGTLRLHHRGHARLLQTAAASGAARCGTCAVPGYSIGPIHRTSRPMPSMRCWPNATS